MGEIKLMANA